MWRFSELAPGKKTLHVENSDSFLPGQTTDEVVWLDKKTGKFVWSWQVHPGVCVEFYRRLMVAGLSVIDPLIGKFDQEKVLDTLGHVLQAPEGQKLNLKDDIVITLVPCMSVNPPGLEAVKGRLSAESVFFCFPCPAAISDFFFRDSEVFHSNKMHQIYLSGSQEPAREGLEEWLKSVDLIALDQAITFSRMSVTVDHGGEDR